MLSKKITLQSGGAMLRTWFLNVEVKSSSSNICNLGYLDYLGDQIR
jgi:hypothetical protein